MKVILVYSGGLDSTTLLYHLLARRDEVKAISFNYGQRHSRELDCARRVAEWNCIEHRVIDLSAIGRELLRGSSQTDSSIAVPEGRYDEPSMKATVVPGRNLIMTSIALGWAASLKFDAIALGIHSGDHEIYPDCRPEWVRDLAHIASRNDWHRVGIETPFLTWSKGEIAVRALELSVPLDDTWTCYKGGEEPCGKCGSCVERMEAFTYARKELDV